MFEIGELDTIDELDVRYRALTIEHPGLFQSPVKPEVIEALRKNEAEAWRLRAELNDFGAQLCSRTDDRSSQIYGVSEAIRVLDATLKHSLVAMKREFIFGENYDELVKVGKKRLRLNAALALEVRYMNGSVWKDRPDTEIGDMRVRYERIRKIYRVLHLIFSPVHHKRKKSGLNGHFGWMFLNLSVEALREMDMGHVIGRVWDANDMDGFAKKDSEERGLTSKGSCSATLIWNREGARGFDDEPEYLTELSPATIQMERNRIMRRISELMSETTRQTSSRSRPFSA